MQAFEAVLMLELSLAKRTSYHENACICQSKRAREADAHSSEPADNDAAEDIAAEDDVVHVAHEGQDFVGSDSRSRFGNPYGGWACAKGVLSSTTPSRKPARFEAMRAATAPAAARTPS